MQILALFLACVPLSSSASAPAVRQDPQSKPGAKRWTQAELEQLSRTIEADIEGLRGERFERPVSVRISSKADLIEYAKQREAKHVDPKVQRADERIAKLLGAIPPDLDLRAKTFELLESQVAGFYDPDTDSFSLMEELPLALTRITLAHELDHALDDQLFGIDATLERLGDDTDAQLAFQAVVEGSGTAVMTQWTLANAGSLDMSSISQQDMDQMTSLSGAPAWMWKPMLGVYMAGAAFLQRTESLMAAQTKPVNSADIRAAFKEPPRSTEQILHPAKYWDPAQRDEPTRLTFETSGLAEGWSLERQDTLGELMIAIQCTPPQEREGIDLKSPAAILGIAFSSEIAKGWDGDRLALISNGDACVLRWVSVWDSERDAGEYFGAMHTLRANLETAARALSVAGGKDCGASIEYGAGANEVIVTLHVDVRRTELKRVLRGLAYSRS
ncbi:MAG: hypothetical protein IT454_04810 [Planctomycetes bacterium]|nr:hypothetical protein [Planctomycetota bacterium]